MVDRKFCCNREKGIILSFQINNNIVTVVISETAKSSNSADKSLAENDTSALGGGTFSAAGGNKNIGFQAQSTSAYCELGC